MKKDKLDSYLKGIIQESIDDLDNKTTRGVLVERVVCSNKKDATIYVYDESGEKDINEIISTLRKSSKRISYLVMVATGWFKSPKLIFKLDKQRENVENMDKLFAQIRNT
jgi:ribosome-binding factor A